MIDYIQENDELREKICGEFLTRVDRTKVGEMM